MGTKFTNILQTTKHDISTLHGKVVAVDGMNMLFQILNNPYQQKQRAHLPYGYYLDRTQRVITHLYGWLQKINHFYKAKFLPVVVFDGKPDTFKRMDHKDHARAFRGVEQNYRAAMAKGDTENARRFALGKTYMFSNCVRESKQILQAAGIPVIKAPTEAEAQCAYLQQIGKADYVVSTDYDVALFGATKIIRKLTFSGRKQVKGKWISTKPALELIDMDENIARLRLSREQLIDASILLGNDFFRGIANMGPKRVLDSLYQYRSIAGMRRKHPSIFQQLPVGKYHRIRKLFLEPEVITPTANQLRPRPFNRKGLEHLLTQDHTLNSEKIEKKLDKLEKAHGKWSKLFGALPSTLSYASTGFDVHLQRRLDRGKKSSSSPGSASTSDDGLSLTFQSADTIKESKKGKSGKSGKSKRKKYVQGRIATEFGVLKIKGKGKKSPG